MSKSVERLAALIEERFAGRVSSTRVHVDEVTVEVPAERLREVALEMRDGEGLRFAQLVDACGVDYLDYGVADWEGSDRATVAGYSRGVESNLHMGRRGAGTTPQAPVTPRRFAAVYHLLSHELNQRVRVRCYAEGDPPRVDSVVEIWPGANWFEREAFDLYGILFVGHPDLRRILTDYGFIGHPFRKDFPLSGEVEMRFDPDRRRVIYEPVSIEPRTLVPKVIRHDERYSRDTPGERADA